MDQELEPHHVDQELEPHNVDQELIWDLARPECSQHLTISVEVVAHVYGEYSATTSTLRNNRAHFVSEIENYDQSTKLIYEQWNSNQNKIRIKEYHSESQKITYIRRTY